MRRSIIRLEAWVLLTAVTLASISCGSDSQPTLSSNTATANTAAPAGEHVAGAKFTSDELDQLLAPIALYPDPLVAQIIPAATFVDQIREAQQKLNGKSDDSLIANQDWDVSVKSIAHYPPVLKRMADDVDWTTTLGQAYINQPGDVSKSIQRLRLDASDAGNLRSTPQQEVIAKDDIIRIEPAQPQVIYVPEYNPETVYVEEPEQEQVQQDDGVSTGTAIAIGAIAFGAGLAIGSWLNRDYDYYGYYGPPGVYYHGWSGGGWIGVNRGYADVDINRNVYVNNSYSNINVNRNVINRNVANYRGNLSRNAVAHNQRVTNARVNRQLNRQPGRTGADTLDRNRNPNSGRLDQNFDRNIGSGPDRNRDLNRAGDHSRLGGGNNPGHNNPGRNNPGLNNPVRNHDRRDVSPPNTYDRQTPNRGQSQRPTAAPRQQPQRQSAPRQQPQRQAPSRGSSGGRRRG